MNTKVKARKLFSLKLGEKKEKKQNINNLLLLLPSHYSMLLLFILWCFILQHFLKVREIKNHLLGVAMSGDSPVAIGNMAVAIHTFLASLINPLETITLY